jgi:hypothetical protein
MSPGKWVDGMDLLMLSLIVVGPLMEMGIGDWGTEIGLESGRSCVSPTTHGRGLGQGHEAGLLPSKDTAECLVTRSLELLVSTTVGIERTSQLRLVDGRELVNEMGFVQGPGWWVFPVGDGI